MLTLYLPFSKSSSRCLSPPAVTNVCPLCVLQVWPTPQFGQPVSPSWARPSRRPWGRLRRASCRAFTSAWAAAVEPWWEECLSTTLVRPVGAGTGKCLNQPHCLFLAAWGQKTVGDKLVFLQKLTGAAATFRGIGMASLVILLIFAFIQFLTGEAEGKGGKNFFCPKLCLFSCAPELIQYCETNSALTTANRKWRLTRCYVIRIGAL